jgi:hypothetical protein
MAKYSYNYLFLITYKYVNDYIVLDWNGTLNLGRQ